MPGQGPQLLLGQVVDIRPRDPNPDRCRGGWVRLRRGQGNGGWWRLVAVCGDGDLELLPRNKACQARKWAEAGGEARGARVAGRSEAGGAGWAAWGWPGDVNSEG